MPPVLNAVQIINYPLYFRAPDAVAAQSSSCLEPVSRDIVLCILDQKAGSLLAQILKIWSLEYHGIYLLVPNHRRRNSS